MFIPVVCGLAGGALEQGPRQVRPAAAAAQKRKSRVMALLAP